MKNGIVYIKQNENSMPVVILNMNVLHDSYMSLTFMT